MSSYRAKRKPRNSQLLPLPTLILRAQWETGRTRQRALQEISRRGGVLKEGQSIRVGL
jgi:hypothetical protein